MLRTLLVLGLGVALGGCYQPMQATSGGHLGDEPPAPAAAIPPPVQSLPVPPKPKPTAKAETYSVVVNNVSVRELLFALARDAKVNVDIHPGITGTVTLNAIDQTLPQLLSRISKQVDMRYELDGPNLAVMPDSPYLRLYKIDYVNVERSTTGQVSVSAEIIGQAAGGAGGAAGGAGASSGGAGGGQNTSRVSVRNSSENQFWTRLVDNIKDILRETDKVLPAGATPAAAAPAQPAGGQAPGGGAGAPGTPAAGPTVTFREAASVIANPEASILTIRATSRQHEKIQEFLDQVLVSAKRQVLIEATIVEVQLSNSYQQGIDWAIFTGNWQLFFGSLFRNAAQVVPPVPGIGTLTALPTGNAFTGQFNTDSLKFSLQLLETFGNVRVLSSPRITAVSNQTAVLKVVENVVYFTISAQQSQTANVGVLATFTTTPNVVPVGIILNLTPQISENDTVLLNVKPTISRITGFVNDPNPALAQSNPPIVSRIPQVLTREMESVIKLSSGQVAVMGGLIQDQLQDNSDTIPGVNRIPLIGDLFANKNIQNSKTELVIFMRPVVIRDPSVEGDYRGYRVFLPGDDFMRQPNPGGPRRCEVPGIEGCPK